MTPGSRGSPSPRADVLGRGARSAVALGVRQFLVQALSAAAAVVLARVLTRSEFGVYGITVFLMHFLVVFGDAGLAAGLVREPEEPAESDYRAIFTFQQLLVVVIAAACLLLHGPLLALLAVEGGVEHLLPAALLALALASFQTTPAARLERDLRFDLLAVVEVAQGLAFNFVAVAGALAGFGAHALSAALVARAAAGAIAVRLATPWPIGWQWNWPRVRSRLRFGLSYQGAAVIALARDALVPVFVGAAFGSAVVGSVFFARMLATYPFVVVSMLQRLLMPLFARLQLQPIRLARTVEMSMFTVSALVVPLQMTVWVLQEPITRIVFGEAWLSSLPVFRWWWLSGILEPQLLVGLALLNALGRADRSFRLVVVTTLATWAAGVPLLWIFGPSGAGMAGVLLLFLKWPLVREADFAAHVESTRVVAPVWAAGFAGAACAAAMAALWEPTGPVTLLAEAAISVLACTGFLLLFAPSPSLAVWAWARKRMTRPAAAALPVGPRDGQ